MGTFMDIHAHGYLEDQYHCVADGKEPLCNLDPRNLFNTMKSPFRRVLEWYRDKGCKGVGELTDASPERRTGRMTAGVYRKVARENHVRLLGL